MFYTAGHVLPDQEGRSRDRLPDADLRRRRRCAASRSTTRSSGRSIAARTRPSCTTILEDRPGRRQRVPLQLRRAANGNIRAYVLDQHERPTSATPAAPRLDERIAQLTRSTAPPTRSCRSACARARTSTTSPASRLADLQHEHLRRLAQQAHLRRQLVGAWGTYTLNATFDHSEYFYEPTDS